jgi:hypothetical protein
MNVSSRAARTLLASLDASRSSASNLARAWAPDAHWLEESPLLGPVGPPAKEAS